jgi:hypothetical protein
VGGRGSRKAELGEGKGRQNEASQEIKSRKEQVAPQEMMSFLLQIGIRIHKCPHKYAQLLCVK